MLRTPIAILASLSIAACATPESYNSETQPMADAPIARSAADEAKYQQRYDALVETFRTGLGLDSYDLMEAVPGAVDPAALPQVSAGGSSIDAAALASAREYAATTNSFALLVWKDGKLQSSDYFGDTTRDTPIVSRSLAKPVTAIAVGRAIELGFIESLDQPAADFITEWKGKPQEKILIRHFLDMRSGFLPQGAATSPDSILNRAYLHPRHDEIIIEEMPMAHEPGAEYQYANATAEMIAPVIERASGMRYSEFLSRHVLQPIGAVGGEVWINRPGGMAHSGCCILLPSEDWMRLAVLLLQDGEWDGKQLLPAGYVKQMRAGTAQNPWYGMGVYASGKYRERRGAFADSLGIPGTLHSEPYAAEDLFLFDGNGNQTAFIVPSADLVVLRLGTSPTKPAEWDNSILPNTILRGIDFAPGTAPKEQPR